MSVISLSQSNFTEEVMNSDKPVLIYGTGNGCEKLFFVFERFGIRPAGRVSAQTGTAISRSTCTAIRTIRSGRRAADCWC